MNALPLWQLLTITLSPTALTLYSAWLHRRSVDRICARIDRHIDGADAEDMALRRERNERRLRLELPPI